MEQQVRDKQTVSTDGERIDQLPEGVSFHEVVTQVDDRGTVVELFDARWGWCSSPLVYAYTFTLRPGFVKGWGLHKHHEDRYFILFGEVEVVLYDARESSSTRGLVSKIVMSDFRRRLLNIPAGIWHADRNLGSKDAVLINFPTKPFDHANPDKYRLPLDNEVIPHKFDRPLGG